MPEKILYGVMGVGNGHVAKALQVAPYLKAQGAAVDFLFTGRDSSQYSNMEVFGDYRTAQGFSFVVKDGDLKTLKTMFRAASRAPRLMYDTGSLNVKDYDLVITDYEPVSAWAAKMRGVPSIGFGHQYAFRRDVPKPPKGKDRFVMNHLDAMAPADIEIGVHWHHFNQSHIVPSLVPADLKAEPVQANKILAYLPFESRDQLVKLFQPFSEYEFHLYHPANKNQMPERHGNVLLKAVSPDFRKDFSNCAGLISNGGFEAPSEALQLGKAMLIKPLMGQPEQVANGMGLTQLGVAKVCTKLGQDDVSDWLSHFRDEKPKQICYPNVAKAFAEWVMQSDHRDIDALTKPLWEQVEYNGLDIR